jgi:undecaprenyl-diphosphatase
VLNSALWGLVQGLTEFLPVSSSGHLVLVPALFETEGPDLATSAVLHLGTLAAVIAYYRTDIRWLLRFRTDAKARRLILLLALATIPAAAIGFTFEQFFDDLNEDPTKVAVALLVTGVFLIASEFLRRRNRPLDDLTPPSAFAIGMAQAAALVPGISRSGATITAGLGFGLEAGQAARFSFLMAIPAIAGSGLSQALDLADAGGLKAEIWVGVVVAAVVGYLAIAVLIRLLRWAGLAFFGVYCLAFGTLSLIVI